MLPWPLCHREHSGRHAVLLLSWKGFICPTFLPLSGVPLAPCHLSLWLQPCQQLVELPACSCQPSNCCLQGAGGSLAILALAGLYLTGPYKRSVSAYICMIFMPQEEGNRIQHGGGCAAALLRVHVLLAVCGWRRAAQALSAECSL